MSGSLTWFPQPVVLQDLSRSYTFLVIVREDLAEKVGEQKCVFLFDRGQLFCLESRSRVAAAETGNRQAELPDPVVSALGRLRPQRLENVLDKFLKVASRMIVEPLERLVLHARLKWLMNGVSKVEWERLPLLGQASQDLVHPQDGRARGACHQVLKQAP
jgi:hypothetical protein